MEGLSCLTWIPTKDLVRRTISEVSTECASVFSRSLGVSLGFHCVAVSCMVTITTKSQGSLCLDTQELLVAIWPHSFSGMCRKSFLQVYWECVETPQTDTVFVRNSFLSPGKICWSVVKHSLFLPLWKSHKLWLCSTDLVGSVIFWVRFSHSHCKYLNRNECDISSNSKFHSCSVDYLLHSVNYIKSPELESLFLTSLSHQKH